MKKLFWPLLLSLSIVLTILGFIRTSSFKQNEQDIIASIQSSLSDSEIHFLQFISDYGKYINIGIPVLILIAGLALSERRVLIKKALMILLAMGLSGGIAQTIKRTLREPRPYEVDSRITQWSVGGSNSFPSGHTAEVTASMVGIAVLIFRSPLTILLSAAWAALMMFSRIALGVHNFTDICGGIVTGCISVLVISRIFDAVQNRRKTQETT